ncbi:hypothetical protein WAB17_13300 [Parerythrobacter aurantius]|uniref:hypothetical protein n=1 Tax=Parerythrobacter aurantius TaxID=3127706 RepID=UPI003247A783
MELTMARVGTAFFDNRGNFHKTPEEATVADLAALLGKIGDGESLAPGIAYMLLERRAEIEALFADYDAMKLKEQAALAEAMAAANVTSIDGRKTV